MLVVEVASAYSIIIMIGSPTALFNRGGIHMNSNSLSHTKWNCKYHIVFAPKYSVVDLINYQNTDLLACL